MKLIHFLLASSMLVAVTAQLEPRCAIYHEHKDDCGYFGITRQECVYRRGCCYDDRNDDIFWCYKPKTISSFRTTQLPFSIATTTTEATTTTLAPTTTEQPTTPASNPNKLSMIALLQMKRDNVPRSIINSLLADSVENGELLYALRDGVLDSNEFLQLSSGTGLSLNPVLAQYLSGGNMKGIIYSQVATAYGVDPTIMQLMMTDNSEAVTKHLAAAYSAERQLDPMSQFILHTVTSSKGLSQSSMTDFVVNQVFQHESPYSREAFKSFVKGDRRRAIQWAFLAANEKRAPLKAHYPKNEAIFAYMVDNQKDYPGKISPSIIFSLAMNQSVAALGNEGKTFLELFGVRALDYVCAIQVPDERIGCIALQHRIGASSLDCIRAGCCLDESPNPFEGPQCYENIYGNIGVGIVEQIWDEEYIINEVFGGVLPELESFYPDGIPWIPSSEFPSKYTNSLRRDPNQPSWFNVLFHNGGYMNPRPTLVPIGPNKFRPNFVWKPHGPTAFPAGVTSLPGGAVPVATHAPGLIDGSITDSNSGSEPVVQSLSLQVFASCRRIEPKERYSCMANSVALADGGAEQCEDLDCCYDPVWTDLSVPACFRKADYGQCHTVPPELRRDCGHRGISKDECLENPRCCYNSTISTETMADGTPWCYLKLQSYVTSDESCKRVSHSDREPCFPLTSGYNYNKLVTKDTCERASGCCYEKVRISYFLRALGRTSPPSCYKKIVAPIVPTLPPPTTTEGPAPEPTKCRDSGEMDPRLRVDCGSYFFHTCVNVMECCYIPEHIVPGVPWCFKKS